MMMRLKLIMMNDENEGDHDENGDYDVAEVDDDENGGDGNITGSCVTGARDLALAEASTPPGPTHHHLHHHHHHQ